MVFLKKKAKPEDINPGLRRASTVPSQRPSAQQDYIAAQSQQLLNEPDYRPSVVSILDQEWVHQVLQQIIIRYLRIAYSFDLRPSGTG